jgi:hypothetical protein
MEQVVLKFSDLYNLWQFKIEIDVRVFELNAKLKTITCACSPTDLQIAISKYGAKEVSKTTDISC